MVKFLSNRLRQGRDTKKSVRMNSLSHNKDSILRRGDVIMYLVLCMIGFVVLTGFIYVAHTLLNM